jgi:hypothetical protein
VVTSPPYGPSTHGHARTPGARRGKVRKINRPAAETALKVKLRDRTTPNDDQITRDTRLTALADLWLDEITDEDRIAPQTRNWYAQILRTQVLAAVGDLRVREATVGRLHQFLRTSPDYIRPRRAAPRWYSAR